MFHRNLTLLVLICIAQPIAADTCDKEAAIRDLSTLLHTAARYSARPVAEVGPYAAALACCLHPESMHEGIELTALYACIGKVVLDAFRLINALSERIEGELML